MYSIYYCADDRAVIWFNGKKVAAVQRMDGIEVVEIPVLMRRGRNELLIKTDNSGFPPDKRCRAIHCTVEYD